MNWYFTLAEALHLNFGLSFTVSFFIMGFEFGGSECDFYFAFAAV